MHGSKFSLVFSRFKKVDGFINYINSWKRYYRLEDLRDASVKQLSGDCKAIPEGDSDE
jgi:hypothetical protein